MQTHAFRLLLQDFTRAAEAGDGRAFAACFTPDGIYHDYIYGDHIGRDSIADMLENYFHRDATDYRWEMFDPICAGDIAYAWSLSSFESTVPDFKGRRVVIDGMSRFRLRDGLIADYRESVNGGVAMRQLGVPAERMGKVFDKWAGWLKERPETQAFMARKKA